MALINGRSYDWSMIEFNFSNITGTPIAGITGIQYERERSIVNNYGVGSMPISKGYGNIEFSASITMDMNASEQLKAVAPNGLLENLGIFDLIVSYNHPETGATVVDTIKGCVFSNQGTDVSQSDTSIDRSYDLNPGEIEFGDS